MCQEVHLSEIRDALSDYCDELNDEQPVSDDDLLAQIDDSVGSDGAHAAEHASRARRLSAAGDENGAAIHEALVANMLRATG